MYAPYYRARVNFFTFPCRTIEKKEVNHNEAAIRNAVNSLSKASLAAAVAAANSAAAYSTAYAATAGGAPHHGSHISVINTTRQSNLITVPLQSEAGGLGGPEPVGGQPVYAPPPAVGGQSAVYPAYASYAAGSAPAQVQPPPAVGYPPPPASTHFSQPPPSYPYSGSYGGSGAAAAQYPAPGGQYQQAPPPGPSTAAYSAAPPGAYSGPAGAGQYQGQWSRPPPSGPHQPYYRRN
jgi:hypothetical protein